MRFEMTLFQKHIQLKSISYNNNGQGISSPIFLFNNNKRLYTTDVSIDLGEKSYFNIYLPANQSMDLFMFLK